MYEQELFSVENVARILGISESSVRRLVDAGELPPAISIPGLKQTQRWWRIDIEAYLHRLNGENSEKK